MSTTEDEKPAPARDSRGRLLPGHSGNPNGREKGSRSKFGEQMVTDFLESWQKNGKRVLQEAADKDQATYLRVACAILPKVIELGDETKDAITSALTSIPFDAIRSRKEASEEQSRTTH